MAAGGDLLRGMGKLVCGFLLQSREVDTCLLLKRGNLARGFY